MRARTCLVPALTALPWSLLALLGVLSWAALPALPARAQAPSGNEDISGLGYIDWVNQRAWASGYGVPQATAQTAAQANISARRAAVVDARRNLLEVVKKVRIDSVTRVENLMTVSDAIQTRVQGIIQYAAIMGEQRKADGSFVVAVSVPLVGDLAKELLLSGAGPAMARPAAPDRALSERLVRLEDRVAALENRLAVMAQALHDLSATDNAQAMDERMAAMAQRLADLETRAAEPEPRAALAAQAGEPPYTGLVVDARGTGFRPCLRPRLLGPGGPLYPGPGVDEAVAVRQGFARYYRDLSQAQQSAAAGDTPRTVKALPASKDGDLVLAAEDTGLLERAMAAPSGFLANCRVVVVF